MLQWLLSNTINFCLKYSRSTLSHPTILHVYPIKLWPFKRLFLLVNYTCTRCFLCSWVTISPSTLLLQEEVPFKPKLTGPIAFCFILLRKRVPFFFFFDGMEPNQGKALWTHPWGLNHGYMIPPAKTMYQVIQGHSLWGFKPRMFGFKAHPNPLTTTLHLDGLLSNRVPCSNLLAILTPKVKGKGLNHYFRPFSNSRNTQNFQSPLNNIRWVEHTESKQ